VVAALVVQRLLLVLAVQATHHLLLHLKEIMALLLALLVPIMLPVAEEGEQAHQEQLAHLVLEVMVVTVFLQLFQV
jgi:hypothetical protein